MSNQAARRKDSEPVLIAMSLLAFAQIFFAGAGLSDILGADVVFLGMLLVGAAQGGIGVWVRGQTVAVDNVVAYVSPASTVVAGSALMGVQTGVPVDVVPAA